MDDKRQIFFFTIDGSTVAGPTSLRQIREDLNAGYLPAGTRVSDSRRVEWLPVGEWEGREAAPAAAPANATPGGDENRAGDVVPAISGGEVVGRVVDHITGAAGVEKLEGFRLRDFFAEVFSTRSEDEMERRFCAGGPETTPGPDHLDTGWPRPWMFARVLLLVLVIYQVFVQAWLHVHNTNLIPAILITGSFAVPLTAVVFFFEVNQWRNVSLYQVLKWFAWGGVVSLVATLFLFELVMGRSQEWLGSSLAGPVEELAKVVATALVARKARHSRILNGLLAGAAVGAGFAAFESAGFALRYLGTALMEGHLGTQGAVDTMTELITRRGVLAPLCHVPWTACTAAALWSARGGAAIHWDTFLKPRFLRIFAIVAVLHMAWNAEWGAGWPFFAKYLALGAVVWVLVFALIQSGMRELRATAAAARRGGDSRV
jgi:RsiW-degrading membrane proteinase PrsW (M82 family)